MPRVALLVCVSVLAITGACTDFSDTPDPLIGTWVRVDAAGTVDPIETVTYHPDHTLELIFDAETYTGTWRRLDENRVEHCTPACYTRTYRGDVDGGLILEGNLLSGPSTPGLAGTEWTGGWSGCCANGSSFFTSVRLELHGDGTAFYQEQPMAMGPPGRTWNGTWTEAALGAVFVGESPLASRIRIGDVIGTQAYRRTTELR